LVEFPLHKGTFEPSYLCCCLRTELCATELLIIVVNGTNKKCSITNSVSERGHCKN